MRNLAEYPLTVGEVLTAVQEAQEAHLKTKVIGSTTGISLLIAEQFMRTHEAELKAFIAQSPAAGKL